MPFRKLRPARDIAASCLVVSLGCFTGGCSKGGFLLEATSVVSGCPTLTGTSWVPNVEGVASSNHDSESGFSETTATASGPLTGLGQPTSASREVEVRFTIPEDLGPSGSVTLTADVTEFPSALSGKGYALLVYLSDGVSEFVNLARGDLGACSSQGYFTCDSGGVCAPNVNCSIAWPSAFSDRTRWEQRQFPVFGSTSVNIFPTCNWNGGLGTSTDRPSCAFNSHFFGGGERLRTGTYTARYVLLADRYKSLSGYDAGLRVTVLQKKDPNGIGGALDLNIVLVGSSNVAASRTEQGKRNLDTLLSIVSGHFNTTELGIKIASVQVYEWGCESGGDAYARVVANDLGGMFEIGSARLSNSASSSLNVFLVDEIAWDGDGTILGISGAIGGPVKPGLPTSGLAFTSFRKLGSFNPSCSSSICPPLSWEHDFAEMGQTISHEIGHYLGLNHPTHFDSADGTMEHDLVDDTPVCTTTDTVGGKSRLTINSCLADSNVFPMSGRKCGDVCVGYNRDLGVFCPDALECQFNHIMWWSSKNFKNGRGDGNAFSANSGKILNYHPLVY